MEWDEIKKEQLEKLYYEDELSDRQIADMFHISKGKVTYKRKKYGINLFQKAYQDYKADNREIFNRVNENLKNRILHKENIDRLSIALAHYLFRNGPIEDMHAAGKLTQNDMKTLNKYMVNRISGILYVIGEGDWIKLEALFGYYSHCGLEWDKAKPDMEELDFIFNRYKQADG